MATILNQHSKAEPERPVPLPFKPAPKTRFPSVGKSKLRPYIAPLVRIAASFLGELHFPSLIKSLEWLGNIAHAVVQGSFLSGVPTNRIASARYRFRSSTHNVLPGSKHPQPSRLVWSPPIRQAGLRSGRWPESSGIVGAALCMRFLNGNCPNAPTSSRRGYDTLVSTNMKSLPQPLCSWCAAEYKRRHPRTEPPLCPACRAQLSNASTETLVGIIAQLATYNHVALRLLAEGHQVIEHVRSGVAPPRRRGRQLPEGRLRTATATARSVA